MFSSMPQAKRQRLEELVSEKAQVEAKLQQIRRSSTTSVETQLQQLKKSYETTTAEKISVTGSFQQPKQEPPKQHPQQQQQQQQQQPANANPFEQDEWHWKMQFERLKLFKAVYHHANPVVGSVPSRADKYEWISSVAEWLNLQRLCCARGYLSVFQIYMLQDMGCDGFEEEPKQKKDTSAPIVPVSVPATVTNKLTSSLTSPSLRVVTGQMVTSHTAVSQLEAAYNQNKKESSPPLSTAKPARLAVRRGWEAKMAKKKEGNSDASSTSGSAEEESQEPKKRKAYALLAPKLTEKDLREFGHVDHRESQMTEWLKRQRDMRGASPSSVEDAVQGLLDVGRKKEEEAVEGLLGVGKKKQEEVLADTAKVIKTVERLEGTATATPKIAKQKWVNWSVRLKELKAYYKERGHANPRKGPLAAWLNEQRDLYAKSMHPSMEQVRILRAFGCTGFYVRAQPVTAHLHKDKKMIPYKDKIVSWDTRLQQLKDYKEKHGHVNPPQSRRGSQFNLQLGRWLMKQRQNYRDGKLKPEKQEQLRDLGCKGFGEETEREEPTEYVPVDMSKLCLPPTGTEGAAGQPTETVKDDTAQTVSQTVTVQPPVVKYQTLPGQPSLPTWKDFSSEYPDPK